MKNIKDLEQVVGLQTDKPLKRAFMPYGGIKMAEAGLHERTDMSQVKNFMRFLQNTTKLTIRQYLMFIHRR